MSILDIILIIILILGGIITTGIIVGWAICEVSWRAEVRHLRKLAEMERGSK